MRLPLQANQFMTCGDMPKADGTDPARGHAQRGGWSAFWTTCRDYTSNEVRFVNLSELLGSYRPTSLTSWSSSSCVSTIATFISQHGLQFG